MFCNVTCQVCLSMMSVSVLLAVNNSHFLTILNIFIQKKWLNIKYI